MSDANKVETDSVNGRVLAEIFLCQEDNFLPSLLRYPMELGQRFNLHVDVEATQPIGASYSAIRNISYTSIPA